MALLKGVKVLDLTRLLPGPLATLQLADHGADVLKIEDTGQGDYARTQTAFGVSMSHLFHALNRGKKSLSVDLRTQDGREVLRKLLLDADVIVDSFRPGTMEKLGFGYDAVKDIKPDIIFCSITAFGQTGPYRNRAAHDINMAGYAGAGDQIGGRGGPPAPTNFQIADIAGGGLTAAGAIAMALYNKAQTGEGAFLDISMTDSVLAHNVMPFTNAQLLQRTPERGADLLSGALACYDYYKTSDGGYMAVGALEPKFWRAFCEKIGREDLIALHMKFGDEAAPLRETLEEIFLTRTREEWTAFLEETDCCISPVLTPTEAQENEQIQARGMIYTAEDPVDGALSRLANPICVNGETPRPQRPAPRHGEHTDEILRRAGYTDAEIVALHEAGAVKSEQP